MEGVWEVVWAGDGGWRTPTEGTRGFLEVVKEGQESQLLTAVAPPPPSEAAHTCVVRPGTQRKGELPSRVRNGHRQRSRWKSV